MVDIRDPRYVNLPSRGTRAIPELGSPLAGYDCPDCEYLTINKKKWQSHARQNGYAGSSAAARHRVQLQTFSRGRHARYWVVRDEQSVDSEAEHGGGQVGVDNSFQSMLRIYKDKYNVQWEERRQIADDP